MHLWPVSVSKVSGVMNWVALRVMMTSTSAPRFFSALATFAILYAAMPPVTPSRTHFPCKSIPVTLPIDGSFSPRLGRNCQCCPQYNPNGPAKQQNLWRQGGESLVSLVKVR